MISGLDAGQILLLLFGIALVFMMIGVPIAFSIGTSAFVIIFLLKGGIGLGIIASRLWGQIDSFVLTSLPMFVFMGLMLEHSGIASQLYEMMHKWSGGLRGGLASGTVFICMIMAAMTGLSATATLTMGLTALPEMLKRGYDKRIAVGCIGAGGALGILIPPSITMVYYAIIVQAPLGQLFIGGIIPGVMLGMFFIIYITIRCALQPSLGPALPQEERANWHEKFVSTRKVLLPIFIILMVLGSIFTGIATPTEAAGIGAIGTMISAAINRTLSWRAYFDSCLGTAKIGALGLWLVIGGLTVQSISYSVGAPGYFADLFEGLPGGKWGALISTQIIWFILGCLIDPVSIVLITGPIFAPAMAELGFNLVWYGVVFIVNMEMAYLTPPYGVNLFYLRAVAPKGVTMRDIYGSITPFILCQALALVLVIVFPSLILWLPSKMG